MKTEIAFCGLYILLICHRNGRLIQLIYPAIFMAESASFFQNTIIHTCLYCAKIFKAFFPSQLLEIQRRQTCL